MIDDEAIVARYREHAVQRPRSQVDAVILRAAARHRIPPPWRYLALAFAATVLVAAVSIGWFGSGRGVALTTPLESAGIAEGRSDGLAGQTAFGSAGLNEGRTVDALTRAL